MYPNVNTDALAEAVKRIGLRHLRKFQYNHQLMTKLTEQRLKWLRIAENTD